MHLEGPSGLLTLVVEGCLRRNLDCVHLVRVPQEVEDVLRALEDQEVVLEADWERRMDHVSQTYT